MRALARVSGNFQARSELVLCEHLSVVLYGVSISILVAVAQICVMPVCDFFAALGFGGRYTFLCNAQI